MLPTDGSAEPDWTLQVAPNGSMDVALDSRG